MAILLGLLIINLAYANCVEIAQKTYNRGIRWGYSMRLVSGYFEGKAHRWTEYFYKDKWRVWDEAIWYVKKSYYTADELGYITFKTWIK